MAGVQSRHYLQYLHQNKADVPSHNLGQNAPPSLVASDRQGAHALAGLLRALHLGSGF